MKYAHIIGWGMYVPEKIVTNDELAQTVDTSDEWIRSRTGIRERRIVENGQTTSSMAIAAAREAIDRARILPSSVDLVIVATLTPDHIMPATACLVQHALGAKKAAAFDLSAGCTGFVYALSMAVSMIKSEAATTAVVIGAETMSCLVDWEDRSTCVLFGDGAGAVVLKASEVPGGVMSTILGSDGAGGSYLHIPAGGSKMPTSIDSITNGENFLKMNGNEVFKFASRVMGKAAKEACEQANVKLEEIDLFVPHQANARIIQSAVKYLKLTSNKVYKNLDKYGNTSSASIPIALCEAIKDGLVNHNDHIVLVGFGGGLTWGASVIKWGIPTSYKKRQWWYRSLRSTYYIWVQFVAKIAWALHVLEGKLAKKTYSPLEDDLEDDLNNNIQTEIKDLPIATTIPQDIYKNNTNGNGTNGNGVNGFKANGKISSYDAIRERVNVDSVENKN